MNKAITDGVQLTPPPFANGLNVWSSGDGTPGSDTYSGAINAAFVPADPDFGGCLEMQKTQGTQKLRYMGETPLLPGCYLQVRARVKAISGNLPGVRIAAWAGGAGGVHQSSLPQVGPTTTLTSYGNVVEVSAIVGAGARGGVDMVWGRAALYGHFGLDLTGANGGVVRIEDIEIVDITSAFLRTMLNIVDVRDYGAVGDGVTDDSAAFNAADAAADGRTILIPEGVFRLADTVTLSNRAEFRGTVTMPTDKALLLQKSFDLATYIDAFGSEELAFRKAFQALLNNADHESLDMGGRKVRVTGPIDMQAAVPDRTSYATRRLIRNGQLDAAAGAAWDPVVVTSQATYNPGNSRTLSNVTNIASIPIGALVEGNGVGREIYVRDKNEATQEITLSAGLYDAAGTQNYTFTRFQYILDFSGFSKLSKFALTDIEFQCNGVSSGIMLAPSGKTFALTDCFISRPRDRGISSHGGGCQGLLVDRCQFLTNEDNLTVSQRKSVALNANAQDVKLRNCRATKFKHFAFLGGSNNIVIGNHFFQGDEVANGVRSAGIILADTHCSSNFTGNYVDNCYIEWTNERDSTPDFSAGYSFSALSITDNVFLSGAVAPWFSYIVIKPHGTGHFLNGLTITGNKFRSILGTIDRAEAVDTSFSSLDFSRTKHVSFEGNTYHAVSEQPMNPLRVTHDQNSVAQTWVLKTDGLLPFGGWARGVDGVVPVSAIRNAAGQTVFAAPYVQSQQGTNRDEVHLIWPEPVSGKVVASIRVDK